MNITSTYPQHPLLKKHIRYIYFLSTGEPSSSEEFYVFPNLGTAISVAKGSISNAEANELRITETDAACYDVRLQVMRKEPVLVKIKGRVNEITIVFTTLGFNHFITDPVNELLGTHNPSNIPFDHYNDLLPFCAAVFDAQGTEAATEVIENYFLSKLVTFSEPSLELGVKLLMESNGELKIAELSKALGLQAKAIERLFIKHLAITPVAFRTIIRFRYALKAKSKNTAETSTKLAYGSNFYDQSHFINTFRKITGKSPGFFFRDIQAEADGNYIIDPFV